MGSSSTEFDDQSTADGTPEDVAALYSWANLKGAKYRDYSASRREYRAQVRYRAAKTLLERELAHQMEAEASAAAAERAALKVEATPRRQIEDETNASRVSSLPSAEGAARSASSLPRAERVEAARRAESAARASVLALREEREIADAHSSALRQASVYEQSELRRRQLAGPQPFGTLGNSHPTTTLDQNSLTSDNLGHFQQFFDPGSQSPMGTRFSDSSVLQNPSPEEFPLIGDTTRNAAEPGFHGASVKLLGPGGELQLSTPAWLNSSLLTARAQTSPAALQAFKGDAAGGLTLQDSRERVAARWFALKGVFEHAGPELAARQPIRASNGKTPLLAVFSLAGGVGKTSLVATLGRALASHGEKVVLADTTPHGLLGVYFGSREGRTRDVEVVPTPMGTTDPPISIVIHDFAGREEDDRQRDILTEEVLREGDGNHRLILDFSTGSSWFIRRMVNLHPTVLVPIAPDMNSVISLQAVERLFRGFVDFEGRSLLPYYVLNQFDASLPLHLDIREVFRRQLGDRLLHFAIRRSQAVSEALADGMTVLDYAPEAPVSQDYRDIALWLRSVSPPATEESRRTRWGGR